MAHLTDVTPVKISLEASDSPMNVVDPVCQQTLERKKVRHLLVRGEQTFYFCSKDCQLKFIEGRKGASTQAA